MFVEITEEKLVQGAFYLTILNRVKTVRFQYQFPRRCTTRANPA